MFVCKKCGPKDIKDVEYKVPTYGADCYELEHIEDDGTVVVTYDYADDATQEDGAKFICIDCGSELNDDDVKKVEIVY